MGHEASYQAAKSSIIGRRARYESGFKASSSELLGLDGCARWNVPELGLGLGLGLRAQYRTVTTPGIGTVPSSSCPTDLARG